MCSKGRLARMSRSRSWCNVCNTTPARWASSVHQQERVPWLHVHRWLPRFARLPSRRGGPSLSRRDTFTVRAVRRVAGGLVDWELDTQFLHTHSRLLRPFRGRADSTRGPPGAAP